MNQIALQAGPPGTALVPRTLEEELKLAEYLADSELVPKDYRGRPGNVFVALQWGRELGLGPMQALMAIAVINGRAAVWGDSMLALVQRHPSYDGHSEGVDNEGTDDAEGWCEMRRRGRDPVRRTFSVEDAKRAKLWGKTGANGPTPWVTYPSRMLMMRARGFAMRDQFADALRGIYSVEEARDTPPEPRDVPNLAAESPAPRPSHPVQARPDSLAEYAAGITNREVQHPEPEAAEDSLPVFSLDGRMHEIGRSKKTGAPALVVWQRTAEREIARAESAEALRSWRATMGPHLGSISSLSPDHTTAVRQVERLIDERQRDFGAEPDAPPD
jgi:hypothetical protein